MSASPRPADRTKLGRPRGPPGLQDGLCLGDPRRPRPPAGQRPTRGVRGGLSALGDAWVRSPTTTPPGEGGGPVGARGPCRRTVCGRTARREGPGGLLAPLALALARRRLHSRLAQRCDRETTKGRSPPGRSCHHHLRSFPRQEVLFSVKSLSRPSLPPSLSLGPHSLKKQLACFLPTPPPRCPGSVGSGRVGSCCSPVAARQRRPENSFQPHLSLMLLGRTSLP